MQPFTVLVGVAAPILEHNVNTDVIIRIERSLMADRAGMGRFAFEAWRFLPDGSENPDFILNRDPFRAAQILLAGANFGCGSSREMAVWALQARGVRCIIAPSFGDIFHENCFKNGVLPIELPLAEVERLASAGNPAAGEAANSFEVSLADCFIADPGGGRTTFGIDPVRRRLLMEGVDELALVRGHTADIERFQSRDRRERPWIYV